MKKLTVFLIVVLVVLVAAAGYFAFQARKVDLEALAEGCEEHNGTWLSEYKECENMEEGWCEEAGGEYLECESACRHDTEAKICTMQCVPVCEFEE